MSYAVRRIELFLLNIGLTDSCWNVGSSLIVFTIFTFYIPDPSYATHCLVSSGSVFVLYIFSVVATHVQFYGIQKSGSGVQY